MGLLACALMASAATAPMAGPQAAGVPQIPPMPVASTPVPGDAPVAPPPVATITNAAPNAGGMPAVAPVPAATASTTTAAPATVSADTADTGVVHDPWEKTNRSIFAFDRGVDRYFLAPVAHGYHAVMPKVARRHISLAIANLDEPITAANDLLQLKIARAGRSVARFVLNSTFGVAGIFDFASHNGLPHRDADFGQTLGRWGAKPGPFVMLPLLGPSNLRDGVGRVADMITDPISWAFGGITTTFGASREGGELVDGRDQSDPALKAIYDSVDPYATERSGYSQMREDKVRDATGKAAALPDFGTP